MTGLSLRALLVLALATALRADFDPAQWQFRRKVLLQGSPAMARIKADPVLYRGSANHLKDVRIVRDGKDVAYLADAGRGNAESRELGGAMLNKAVVPGSGLEFTLDAGSGSMHDQLEIFSPLRDYRQKVRIETSDDRRKWALVRKDGYIAGVSGTDHPISSSSISYPVSTRRYLRITIEGWFDTKAVEAARVSYLDRRPALREVWASFDKPAQTDDLKTRESILTLDIGYVGLAYDAVALRVGPGWFQRGVAVETSPNETDWQPAGQGALSRTMAGQESLTIGIAGQWNRYVRLTIANHDDQPLHIQQVALESLLRSFRFAPATGSSYWLYYGNPNAVHPNYDLQSVAPRGPDAAGVPAGLSAQEPNPDYRPPQEPRKPFSDRYPWLLYAVLAVAIVGMGYVTLRFLKTLNAGASPGS